MKVQHFRHFIQDCAYENPLTEMAWNVAIQDHMPLPPMVTNVLSAIPGGESTQANALKWIFTKGLFEAAHGRKQLADLASKELGRKVYEHEIFSPKAHQQDPALGRLYPRLQQLWESEYEPKFMILPKPRGTKKSGQDYYVDFAKLNAALQKRGLRPFSFGGPNGFMEYMEDGGWARPNMLKSHIRGTPGDGSQHVRNGVDLSDPHLLRFPNRPGKFQYAYNGWKPDMTKEFYDGKLKSLAYSSGQDISKLLHKGEDPKFGEDRWGLRAATPEEQQALSSVIKNIHASNQFTHDSEYKSPFGSKGGTLPDVKFDDPKEYDMWKKVIEAGIRAINDEKPDPAEKPDEPWLAKFSEPDIQELMKTIFRDDDMTVRWNGVNPVRRRWVREKKATGELPAKANDRSYMPVNQFYEKGTEILGKLNPDELKKMGLDRLPDMQHSFSHKWDYGSYVGDPEGEYVVIDPQKLLDQGYQLPPGQTLDDAANRGNITLKNNTGAIHLILGEDDEGNPVWRAKNPKGSFKPYKKYDQSPFLTPGRADRDAVSGLSDSGGPGTISTGRRSGAIDNTKPAYKDVASERIQHWSHNLDAFMEKTNKRGYPESVAKAAQVGFNRARQQSGWSGEDLKKLVSGGMNQGSVVDAVVGIAQEAMHSISHGYQFWFGEPGKKIEMKTAGDNAKSLDVDDSLEDNEKDTTIWTFLTTIGGIPANDLDTKEKMVQRFYETIKKGDWPSAQTFGSEDVYKAFLRNGVFWRAYEAAKFVSEAIIKMTKDASQERVISGTDTNGNTVSMAASAVEGDNRRLDARANAEAKAKDLLSQKVTADEERERVDPTHNALSTANQQTELDSKLNPFQKNRLQAGGVNEEQYGFGYRSANTIAKEHLASFRRNVAANQHQPPEGQDELEVRRLSHRRRIFEPLEMIAKMFNNIRNPEQSYKTGTVDGICDAVANEILGHWDQSANLHTLAQQEQQTWARYLAYLYHAFFVNDPKYNLVKLAQAHNVDIRGVFDKVKATIAAADPETHEVMLGAGSNYRSEELADIAKERELIAKQSQVPAQPTQRPGPTTGGVSVPPAGMASYSFGGREDDPEEAEFRSRTFKRTPPPAQPQPQQGTGTTGPLPNAPPRRLFRRESALVSFQEWRAKGLRETGVPVGPHAEYGIKPKKGCGFNYWGAPGLPGGTEIAGEVPVKKKGKKK